MSANTYANEPFGYCLNTSTLRDHSLGIVEEIELASKVGYDGIEPWIRELDAYVEGGGSLEDLGKRLRDNGLAVAGGIAFFKWADADEGERRQALEDARREMDKVARIGGTSIAAPPFGDVAGVSLPEMADCYRNLLAVGKDMGVIPAVEVWGLADRISRLSEAVFIAIESNDPDACVLLDVYHLYKGGGGIEGLKLLRGSAINLFHVNDYPADPPREEIDDADRVFPGDGVAPLNDVFKTLDAIGYRGMLSLELFNPEYYKRDPFEVAKEGLEKTRRAVESALA